MAELRDDALSFAEVQELASSVADTIADAFSGQGGNVQSGNAQGVHAAPSVPTSSPPLSPAELQDLIDSVADEAKQGEHHWCVRPRIGWDYGGEAHGGEAHGGEAHGGVAHGGEPHGEREDTGRGLRISASEYLAEDVSALREALSLVEGKMEEATDRIASLDGNVDVVQDGVLELQGSVASLQEDFQEIKDEIAELGNKLDRVLQLLGPGSLGPGSPGLDSSGPDD